MTGYHAFSDEIDFYTRSKKEAIKQIKEWKKEGYRNMRIYKVMETSSGELLSEDCIFSVGSYPY